MIPKVSVCIPAYNYARFLPQAIESVLSQSFGDFELLVIDDGSTDDTRDVVAGYAAGDGRIVFRANPVNRGMVPNWNLCLRESRGEYVKFLFADDFLASQDALGRMADILDADASVSLVASARHIVGPDSGIIETVSHFGGETAVEGTAVIGKCLSDTLQNLIGEPSVVMFRKRHASRGFDVRYSQLVDLEMWFHLLEQGRFAYIDEPLSAFRVHPDQQSRVNVGTLAHIDDTIALLSDYVLGGGKPYVDLSSFEKAYMLYDSRYQIWKEYKKRRLAREAAIRKLSQSCSVVLFFLAYPLYKTYKPFRKMKRTALRWLRDGSVTGNVRGRERAPIRDAPGADRAAT